MTAVSSEARATSSEADSDLFREKRIAGTATAQDWRNELARRIRGVRAVNRINDPSRGYRASANKCRLGTLSYHRLFGIPKVPKRGDGLV